MAAFDDLPADQKAVLQLVLRQGRTYDEIAGLLKISGDAVRERALTALDALGPVDVAGLPAAAQDDVGDYLLGQQGASSRAATRSLLEASGPARAWGRAVAAELRAGGIAGGDALPEIPADEAEIDEAFGALKARHHARAEQQRSSRLGGWLVVIAIAIVATGLILYAAGAFDGKDEDDSSAASTTTTATTSTTSNGARYEQQVNLKPPSSSVHRQALGVVAVVVQDGQRLIAVQAKGLPTSNHYVLWLRNGTTAKKLGFFKQQTSSGASKGLLFAQLLAPADLADYRQMLITHETGNSPAQPGTIELQGAINQKQ
jgi:hypothetical protein